MRSSADAFWVVDAIELLARCHLGTGEKLTFYPHVDGPDPTWGHRRTRVLELAPELLRRLPRH